MSLIKLTYDQAIGNRRDPNSSWGDRMSGNRVEPIARPAFDVPFRFEPGEPIFTIGSCFARNVETKLKERGFGVPVRELFQREEFRSLDPGLINNFGTPSILNEFRWALDPDQPFVEDENFVEVASEKWVDLHVIPSIRPASREVLQARRRAIIEVNRSVVDCRVVIMTLGLVELWYDERHGRFLNSTPMTRVFTQDPERFTFRVLDFAECLDAMERTVELLKRTCRPDQQLILTVSPVPMASTFRGNTDVMVANTYSKSLLRTVAEHVCLRHPHVHYFPSYESVVLSDRSRAWMEDLVHVTDELIRFNVTRMVQAYASESQGLAEHREAIGNGGLPIAVERAQRVAQGPRAEGEEFFEAFGDLIEQSPEFALAALRFHLRFRQVEQAKRCAAGLPTDPLNPMLAQARAELAVLCGNYEQVPEIVGPVLAQAGKFRGLWTSLVVALAHLGRIDQAERAVLDWMKLMPTNQSFCVLTLARALAESRPELAARHFARAIELGDAQPRTAFGLAEALIRSGRQDQARQVLEKVEVETASDRTERDRLASFVAGSP